MHGKAERSVDTGKRMKRYECKGKREYESTLAEKVLREPEGPIEIRGN
jgi:hypothetical protein